MVTTHEPSSAEDRELQGRIGQAWKELRRGAAMSALRDHLFGSGPDALEPGQFDTLEILVHRPAWRMSELAEALRVDPSTATRAVQRLLRAGLVERKSWSQDGRVVMVSASDEGRLRYDTIASCRRRFLREAMNGFTSDELQVLADLLERLVASVDAIAAATQP
jgi:DNA-binding MarR family transcriptional regulator